MIDIAAAVAHDVTERPQHYKKISEDLSRVLSGFRSSAGSHPDWPDTQQRLGQFRILGAVAQAGGALREAALAYVETATDLNRELLVDVFRESAESFQNQMKSVDGSSLEMGVRQIDQIFRSAMQIFQSDDIMRTFDLVAAPKGDWPIDGSFKDQGVALATELIRVLDAGNFSRTLLGGPKRHAVSAPDPMPLRFSMTQNKFILLQQAAWYGATSISEIIAGSHQGDPLPLINSVYKWTKALQRLVPDVVRAWKDPMYRVRLTDLEWGMIDPHPSEAISLALSRGQGVRAGDFAYGPYSTATVRGEVCCCTGDLACPASSNCEVSPETQSCAGFCIAVR
ncbi:MAG: hypothetical protein ACKV2T_25630 [Kofleriaceae bacterium]